MVLCSFRPRSWCCKATSLHALAMLSKRPTSVGPPQVGLPYTEENNTILFLSPPRLRIPCPEAHFSCGGAEWGSEESVTGLHQTDGAVFCFAMSSSIQRDILQGQVSPTTAFCFRHPDTMFSARWPGQWSSGGDRLMSPAEGAVAWDMQLG